MERSMRALLVKFISNDSGATAIEYALMGSLLALVLVTVLTNLGTRLSTEFGEISGVLKYASEPGVIETRRRRVSPFAASTLVLSTAVQPLTFPLSS
jgi:pilus assembly protein Flp/PilA